MILAITVNIVLATIALSAIVGLILGAIRSSAPQPAVAQRRPVRIRRPEAWGPRAAARGTAAASQR